MNRVLPVRWRSAALNRRSLAVGIVAIVLAFLVCLPTTAAASQNGRTHTATLAAKLTGLRSATPPSIIDVYMITQTGLEVINSSNNSFATFIRLPPGGLSRSYYSVLESACFDPSNRFLYVADAKTGNVSEVNTSKNSVAGLLVNVGSSPFGCVYDGSNHDVYIVDQGGGQVSALSPATGTVLKRITVGPHPGAITYDLHDRLLFITHGQNVSAINGNTQTVVRSANLGAGTLPLQMTYDAPANRLFVDDGASNLWVLYPNNLTVQASYSIPTGSGGSCSYEPGGGNTVFDRSNSNLYITDDPYGGLEIFNTSTDMFTGAVNAQLGVPGLAFDDINHLLYFDGSGAGSVCGPFGGYWEALSPSGSIAASGGLRHSRGIGDVVVA